MIILFLIQVPVAVCSAGAVLMDCYKYFLLMSVGIKECLFICRASSGGEREDSQAWLVPASNAAVQRVEQRERNEICREATCSSGNE